MGCVQVTDRRTVLKGWFGFIISHNHTDKQVEAAAEHQLPCPAEIKSLFFAMDSCGLKESDTMTTVSNLERSDGKREKRDRGDNGQKPLLSQKTIIIHTTILLAYINVPITRER